MELGQYVGNPAFYKLAEQAFEYENTYFDSETNNWPDFRLSMWTSEQISELEEAYKTAQLDVFNRTSDMNTWCHGAAGIGLARIRAYELTGEKIHLADARRALTKVRRTEELISQYSAFSLCHGLSGNAETLLESYLLFGNNQDLRLAERWGDAVIKQKSQTGRYMTRLNMGQAKKQEDAGLFSGIAGIGYFFLRLHDPTTTPLLWRQRFL
jgi:lantibiotic modifying enzyme